MTAKRTNGITQLLGQHLRDGEFDHVRIDNVAAAQAATAHLIETDRRRIGLISLHSNRRRDIAYDRMLGFRRAMRAAGLSVDPALIVRAGGYRRASGAEAMSTLLDRPDPPEAVFCYNDPLALGAMRTVLSRRLRVPEDVAIAGFDDSEDGRFSTPSLTTVSQDKGQIAGLAVDLLVDRMNGETGAPITRHARWELMIRESTTGEPIHDD